jgi:hypothetical protein
VIGEFLEMVKNRDVLKIGFLSVSVSLSACSSLSGWDTQSATEDFIDGTRIIGEVILIATRDQVLEGKGLMSGWSDKLLSVGFTDEDIVNGSEVTVWTYCFGWNSGVDLCAHSGHYVAHVSPQLIEDLQLNSDEATGTSGDLVEVELVRSPEGYLIGKVVAVFQRTEDWGPCREARYQPTSETSAALLTLSGVGPPQGLWIECEGLESAGWTRQPVRGAPIPAGPPISEWIKLPQK